MDNEQATTQPAANSAAIPHAPEVEAAALCCIIENPRRFVAAATLAQLTGEYFHSPACSALWSLCMTRHRAGKGLDPSALAQDIRQAKPPGLTRKDLGDILLANYSEESWNSYVETLREQYARRLAVQAGQKIASEVTDGQAAVELLRKATEQASQALAGSSVVHDSRKAVKAFLQAYTERHEAGRMPGLPTGIDPIDQHTGGMRPSEFWVIGAKTSGGKTVLMLQIAANVVSEGKKVAVFSLELGVDEVVGRMIACHHRIDYGVICKPQSANKRQLEQITAGANTFLDSGLMVCDAGDLSIDAISGHAQRIKETSGLDLVIIDYLQLIPAQRIKGQNREQEVATISRACKMLAKRLRVPVLTASQLNEEGQTRESRALENDADNVLIVAHNNKDEKGGQFSTVQFWKCRNGERNHSLRVVFDGQHQRFTFC